MAVPYTFGSATTSIPLSQLDSNFATTITLGNTAIQLGNTVTTLNNMTLASPTLTTPALGTPASGVMTNVTGIPAAQITGSQAIPKSTLPTGSVLQVVQVSTNSNYSVSASSFTATGFTGSITPTSATSKILVSVSGGQWRISPTAGQEAWAIMYRSIGGGAYSATNADIQEILISPANSIMAISHSLIFLDSPSTTSTVTYQPYARQNSGAAMTIYYNLGSPVLYLTLMEIAA